MRKHILSTCFIVLLAVLAVSTVYAQDSTTTTPMRILGKIRIEGLKRTKESVTRALISLNEGQLFSDKDLQITETELLKSGIFSSVTLTLSPSPDSTENEQKFDLLIRLEEKWSLIPVPYFTTDGKNFNGGLFLIEANLFGYNTFLMTAVYGGTNGLRGLIIYSNPSISGTSWSHTFAGGFGTAETSVTLPDETVVRSFTSQYLNFGAGVGYAINPQTTVNSSITYRNWNIEGSPIGIDPTPVEDTIYLEPKFSISYEKTQLADVLSVGTSASVSSRFLILEEGWEVNGDLSWSMPVLNVQRFRLAISGGYGEMPDIAERSIDANDGYRTLPKSSTADRWGSISAGYDLPIFRTSWSSGIITHFWEYGFYDADVLPEAQLFGGPGFGFRLYLRKVAIPAVGVDIAYNMVDPSWIFSVSVGVQM